MAAILMRADRISCRAGDGCSLFLNEFAGIVARRAGFLEADSRIFPDREEILLPSNSVLIPPKLGAGRLHQQIQSIAIGKFGRLVACLFLSDLDVGKWRGEKGGIVSGWSE
ncbi:hypothetical protein AQ611_08875 [Burkholderia singularis]|nr:hypothetical protein AQ611_08875 [Burkholderia sp. Bp7605]